MIRKLAAILAAITLSLTVTAMAQEKEKVTIQLEGSTTVGPIAEAFAEAFMKANPDVGVTVKKTGSGDGAAALIDGRCQIASMSRFMKDKEFKSAVNKGVLPCCHTIAMDGVCVIVHPSNPVKAITRDELRKIYKGEIVNWKDLNGVDEKIVVVGRETSSGTYEVFDEKVMKKEKIAGSVETVSSNPAMQARVKETKGAVGYVGLGFLDDTVKALSVDNVMPTRKTICAGTYPIARPLFLFTNGFPEPGSPLFKFVTMHLSEKGQEIIDAKGFISLTEYK